MSVGENIRRQREAKGLTQKELADKLFVTPQALSRWEKGDVEPSLDTLKQLAAFFGTSIDELVVDSSKEKKDAEAPANVPTEGAVSEAAPKEVTVSEPAPAPKLVGVCVRCGQAVYEGDSFAFGVKEVLPSGRGHHQERVTYSLPSDHSGRDLLCQNCLNDIQKEGERAEQAQAFAADERRHKAWGWGVFAGVVAFLLALAIGIGLLANGEQPAGIWTLCLSPLAAYLLFSLVFVLVCDNTFVSEVFMDIASFAFVKMPGVIFSLDFDGIAFLIIAKILFAIIGFLIFAGVLALAIAIAGFFAMFMFPVALKRAPKVA